MPSGFGGKPYSGTRIVNEVSHGYFFRASYLTAVDSDAVKTGLFPSARLRSGVPVSKAASQRV